MRWRQQRSQFCSSADLSGFVVKDQPTATELVQHCGQITLGKGKAALAASKLAVFADDAGTDISSGVDDDCARPGIAVLRIKTGQSHRVPVLAGIGAAGH